MIQCLTFKLGTQSFGVPVSYVKEIMPCTEWTALPRGPSFVKGVIHFRGTILPVIDLQEMLRLGEKRGDKHAKDCIIIIEVLQPGSPVSCGWLVDDVAEVITCHDEEFKSTEEFSWLKTNAMVNGIIRKDGNIIPILNPEGPLEDVRAHMEM